MSRRIENAARLHDVGKVGIPPSILSKRGALDASEFDLMRSHTVAGAELLASANIDDAETAIAVARHHHEWWSGTGYPDRLAGSAIPIAARITSLTEAFDAMTHDRPYRPQLSHSSALDVIAERAGHQFDPELARIFCRLIRDLQTAHRDLDVYLERGVRQSVFLQIRQRLVGRHYGVVT
jgi:putative two-component system response regulator